MKDEADNEDGTSNDGPLGPEAETVAREDSSGDEGQTSELIDKLPISDEKWGRVHAFLKWLLPSETDDPEHGRTGPCSTYEECHAIFIGMMVGVAIPAGGLVQTVAAILGAGAAGSRYQKGIPQKYIKQVRAELPHFLAGVLMGYVAVQNGLGGVLL